MGTYMYFAKLKEEARYITFYTAENSRSAQYQQAFF